MNTQEHVSPYTAVHASFGSCGFLAHQGLVADTYSRKGFIPSESASDLIDAYDTEDTKYGLLYAQDTASTLTGTFRLIHGSAGLPIFGVFPHLPVAGIHARLCESTRVVSKKLGLAGRSNPARHVLFDVVLQSLGYARAYALMGTVSLGSPIVFDWINETFLGCQRALASPLLYKNGVVIPSVIWTDEFEQIIQQHIPSLFPYYAGIVESWKIKT